MIISFRTTDGLMTECSQCENVKKQSECFFFKKGCLNKCYNLKFDQFCILPHKVLKTIPSDILDVFDDLDEEEE